MVIYYYNDNEWTDGWMNGQTNEILLTNKKSEREMGGRGMEKDGE